MRVTYMKVYEGYMHKYKETHESKQGDQHEMNGCLFNFDELDEAEQRASSRVKPTWFDWDELDLKEKEERRKEWRSSSSISLEVLENDERIKHRRWMRRQDWKDIKAMKERMSTKTQKARGWIYK